MDRLKKLMRRLAHICKRNPALVKRICFCIAATVAILIAIYGLPGRGGNGQSDESGLTQTVVAESSSEDAKLCIYICGQITYPGVYYVPLGSRVCDVVEMAGGFTDDAATEIINLAREVKDGEQILVHSLEEAESGSSSAGSSGTILININSASSEQLEQLPGVGPSLAARIISYRNSNGAFTSIDDLKSVSGIGDKKLDSLREYVCV